jgi:hypothetical protein
VPLYYKNLKTFFCLRGSFITTICDGESWRTYHQDRAQQSTDYISCNCCALLSRLAQTLPSVLRVLMNLSVINMYIFFRNTKILVFTFQPVLWGPVTV